MPTIHLLWHFQSERLFIQNLLLIRRSCETVRLRVCHCAATKRPNDLAHTVPFHFRYSLRIV